MKTKEKSRKIDKRNLFFSCCLVFDYSALFLLISFSFASHFRISFPLPFPHFFPFLLSLFSSFPFSCFWPEEKNLERNEWICSFSSFIIVLFWFSFVCWKYQCRRKTDSLSYKQYPSLILFLQYVIFYKLFYSTLKRKDE